MADPETVRALQLVLHQMQAQAAERGAAQAAAYVALARHLAARGGADLPALARDLERLRRAQPGEDWRAELGALIGGLRRVSAPPTAGSH